VCLAHNSEIIALRIRQTFLLDDEFAREDAKPPKPGRAEALYWDSKEPGLMLRVLASGGRSWAVECPSKNGKRSIAVLDKCKNMSVAKAREEAHKAKEAAKRGQSLAKKRAGERAARHAPPNETTLTVRQLSVKWMAWGTSDPDPWEPETTARQYKYALDRHILPAFGDKPVDAIERGTVQQLYDAVEQTSRGDALNVIAAIRAMYNWGFKRDLVTVRNPASTKLIDVTRLKPRRNKLNEATYCAFTSLLDGEYDTHPGRAFLTLIDETGCRCSEAFASYPGQIDGIQWKLSEDETKQDSEHPYYLVTPRAIAAAQQAAESRLTYCQREKETVALFKLIKARLLEQGLTFPSGRFHIFRCTRVTRRVNAGMSMALAGRSVGHRSITTTERYFAPSELDVVRALTKAEARLAENTREPEPVGLGLVGASRNQQPVNPNGVVYGRDSSHSRRTGPAHKRGRRQTG
jgi:Phage integrase, N-terminal SAM-like domain/Arm DNA-binding domain